MKDAWKEEICKFEDLYKSKVTKGDFTKVFGNVFHKVFIVLTVLAAFEKTGIHPYNPNVITPQMMKASEPSSLIGLLPIPMPSPICAIMAAFNAHSYTTIYLDPNNFHAPPLSYPPVHPHLSVTEPTTPTAPSHIPQPIASSLVLHEMLSSSYYMPLNCMCMMMSAHVSMVSRSFLVGNPCITLANTITSPVYGWPMALLEPDWSLIHQQPAAGSPSKAELKALNAKLTLSLEQSHAQIIA